MSRFVISRTFRTFWGVRIPESLPRCCNGCPRSVNQGKRRGEQAATLKTMAYGQGAEHDWSDGCELSEAIFFTLLMGISLVAIAGEDKLVSIDAVGPGTQWLEAEAGDGHQLRFVGPQRA